MHDERPRRRSFESLRKDAKRWLHGLEQHDPDAMARLRRAHPDAPPTPTLRDVQHAIALEEGYPGWTALKSALLFDADARMERIGKYEEMATALLDAYRTGTPEAMERHWSLTWHRRAWQGMRTYVQVDLGKAPGPDVEITLDDARYLVAREHGFEHWAALTTYVNSLSSPAAMLTKPVQVIGQSSGHDADTVGVARDWPTALQVLASPEALGIDTHGQATDAMLADLSRIDHLVSLRLGGSRGVTDEGLRHLARLPNLRQLDVSGTAITDEGLKVLRELPTLESINLAWTRTSDAGTAELAHLHGIVDVNLSGTRNGDGAIRALAGKAHLKTLRTGMGTTDAGLALLHEIPQFKRWHGGAPEFALLSYDSAPNQLVPRGNFTSLAPLRGLDGLFGLQIDASELGLTGASLEPIVDLPRLGWLAFDARDDAMPYIARMPHLRFLGCQDTTASDDGFVALSRSQTIEQIWGRRCHRLQRRGFLALSEMPALRGLSVSCLNVDEIGISALPDFPALRELMPMDIPDSGYKHIGRCDNLEALILMYCRDTTDRATEQVTGLPNLRRYFASYTRITDRTPELLSGIVSLERVTFDSCAGLTNAGIAALARLPRLREVSISGQGITADVVKAFPAGVEVRYSL